MFQKKVIEQFQNSSCLVTRTSTVIPKYEHASLSMSKRCVHGNWTPIPRCEFICACRWSATNVNKSVYGL